MLGLRESPVASRMSLSRNPDAPPEAVAPMSGRSGAAALLGRALEQAELYDALSMAMKGEPQVVVVGGDAGVGKTTLVTDLARRAEELGFTVAVGHCLDIEVGISFGPVIEALTTLLAGIEDLDSRPLARRMRAFLDPATPSNGEQRNLLQDLRLTALEAAGWGPVLLVLEDMHWADTSTRDLAVALSRTARGRLLFVLSVRTDDLHRRHPARKALAEIGRVTGGRRVELGPLDRASIAGIVASMSGTSPDPALVRSVLERSEGNPLYAEEIVAAGPEEIPDQLSDLFLARVDTLAEGPRELVRTASVDGTRVDTDTLTEVAGIDQVRLDAFLRDLLDANVLRNVGDSLEFRHGLLREAVYDDLLPDERTRLHADLAAILQARVDADPKPGLGTLSRLAFHWSAAHDLPRTLGASVRAGLRAARVGAAEEVTHLERALSLWDQVPDAEHRAGCTRIELMATLSESAMHQGDRDGGHAQIRRAIDLIGPDTDPLVASRAYSALGFCAFFHEDTIGSAEAIRRAVEYAGDAPTEERAWALTALAQLHSSDNRYAMGVESANRAIEAAETCGCTEALILALTIKYVAFDYLGRIDEARVGGKHIVEVARHAGMVGQALYSSDWLAGFEIELAHVERGMSIAREGYQEGLANGLPVQAAACGEHIVTALTWRGELSAAERLLEELEDLGVDPVRSQRRHGELSLARGDLDAAAEVVPRRAVDEEACSGEPDDDIAFLKMLRLAALHEDTSRCLEVASTCLNRLHDCDSPLMAGSAARIAFHALSLSRPALAEQHAEILDLATIQLERALGGLTDEWRTTYHGVQLALAKGYAARVEGRPAIEEFRVAAHLAEPFGAFFALEPRLDLAQELLAHGSRDEGRELLVDCWAAAHAMGAGSLERRAFRLATRARVPLPESASNEGPLSRLTPREREVLERLARGATNKSIASELVISEKTISVHVSNVLSKLGVENRGAAAALARSLVRDPSHEQTSVVDSSA
jgi:DNA-binding CsgD family transcriptional regulator/tetratricopeptide (TPR) repeat protein